MILVFFHKSLCKHGAWEDGPYYPDACVGCVSHSLQQSVVLWIESDGEGTVYYSTWKYQTVWLVPAAANYFHFFTLFFLQKHSACIHPEKEDVN